MDFRRKNENMSEIGFKIATVIGSRCVFGRKLHALLIAHTKLVEKLRNAGYNGEITLGAIFILRKDIGVGGWPRKWQFSLTLCSENALT